MLLFVTNNNFSTSNTFLRFISRHITTAMFYIPALWLDSMRRIILSVLANIFAELYVYVYVQNSNIINNIHTHTSIDTSVDRMQVWAILFKMPIL